MEILKRATKFLLQKSTRRSKRTFEALFDRTFYLEQVGNVEFAERSPHKHYLDQGWRKGLNPSPLFDSSWYLATYKDVAEANIDPFTHFIEAGAIEGRNPHPLFDTRWYLNQYRDVKTAGINPLLHFLLHGAVEKRDPSPLFSTQSYFWQNPDAINAPTPLHHLTEHGQVSTYLDLSNRKVPLGNSGNGNARIYDAVAARKTPATSLRDLSRIGKPIFYEDLPKKLVEEISAAEEGMCPLISIITPTWNRRHTIARAIESIIAQHYQNFEVILSDDGSEDGTIEFVRKEYSELLSCGKLRILENNHQGVSAARNSALSHSKGEIIAYLDSDNAWHPATLSVYVSAFKSSADIFSVYTPISLIDEDAQEPIDNESNDESVERSRKIIGSPFDRAALLKSNFIDLNGFAHRRELYSQHGDFNESLRRLVDWDLIIRFTKEYPVFYAPVVSTDYYLNKSEIANITHTEPLAENYERVLRIHRREMLERKVLSPTKAASIFALEDFSDPEMLALYQSTSSLEPTRSPRLAVILDSDQKPLFDIDTFKKKYWFVESVYFKHDKHYQLQSEESYSYPDESTVYYPTSIEAMLGPNALYNAFLSITLGNLDIGVISHRGHDKKNEPKIYGKFIRDQLIASGRAKHHWLANQYISEDIVGRILRLETSRFGEDVQGRTISQALQGSFNMDKDCINFWSTGCQRRSTVDSKRAFDFPKLQHDLPPLASFGMKVAVGGVERLTLSVAHALKNRYLSLYLALEPTLHAQGTIAPDIEKDIDLLFEVYEIVGRDDFKEFFKFLRVFYEPKIIFIMNGSMWLAYNANIIRNSFPNTGIVDQQVYDHEVGWIGHYKNPDIQRFDRFVAVNSKIHDAFNELNLDLSRVDQIHHAIDTDRVLNSMNGLSKAEVRENYGLPTDKFISIFAGRLTDQKRPLDFLEHARSRKEHDDELFIFLGDGILRKECDEFIAIHHLDNVISIPFVEDISTIFRATDLLLMTSEYEGLPLVVVEAVCMGLPVLATDVGEIKIVLEKFGAGNAENSPGDLKQIEEAFVSIRSTHSSFAEVALSKSSAARAHFSIHNVSKLYEQSGLKAFSRRSTMQSSA